MSRISVDLPKILEVASDIVDSGGIESLSLSDVAKRLSIKSPSLYNHIDGLTGLRTELSIHGCNLLNASLTQAAIGRAKDSAVRALADAYLTFARSHPGLYEAIQRSPEKEEPRWQVAAQSLVDTVVRVFEHYQMKGYEVIHAVRGFRSLLHGFTSLDRRGGFGMPINLDDSYRFLVDTFLRGLHERQALELSSDSQGI